MQTSKKRIFSAVGLAAVAGMTIIAHGLPTPVVHAETSDNVNLKVVVLASTPTIEIQGDLQNGGATSLPTVTIPLSITNSAQLQYKITTKQGNKTATVIIDGIDLPGTGGGTEDDFNGVYDLELPLKAYMDSLIENNGFAKGDDVQFTLTVTSVNTHGGVAEDSIYFTYGVVTVDPNNNIDANAGDDETNTAETDNKGNPIISVETGEDIEKIHVVVRDPETGEIIWEGDFDTPDDLTKITLPLIDNNIPSGNYIIDIYGYDTNGSLIGMTSIAFRFVNPGYVEAPGLPNTGGSIFSGLNITRADYLISGALIFCLVAAAGIYLIRRQQTRK